MTHRNRTRAQLTLLVITVGTLLLTAASGAILNYEVIVGGTAGAIALYVGVRAKRFLERVEHALTQLPGVFSALYGLSDEHGDRISKGLVAVLEEVKADMHDLKGSLEEIDRKVDDAARIAELSHDAATTAKKLVEDAQRPPTKRERRGDPGDA